MTGRLRPRTLRRAPSVIGAVALVVAVEVVLRTTRLPTMARTFRTPLADADEVSRATVGEPRLSPRETRRLRAVAWVLRRSPFGSTCLRQALCAGYVLRARSPRLAVGVAKRDGTVTAHAWVVVDGVHLDPSGAPDFRPLDVARAGSTV